MKSIARTEPIGAPNRANPRSAFVKPSECFSCGIWAVHEAKSSACETKMIAVDRCAEAARSSSGPDDIDPRDSQESDLFDGRLLIGDEDVDRGGGTHD